jgi:hypothetical protein
VTSASIGLQRVNDASWAGIGAIVGGMLTGLFAWLTQRTKAGSDVEVAVLSEWQKLNGALSSRLSAVERDFAAYRTCVAEKFEELRAKHSTEIDEMRAQHRTEIDEMRKQHRAEMGALRELNEGLQRQIAQNSQSAAQLLSESPVTQPRDEDNGD